ncbi:hypothetical protein BGZ98_001439 [Dissophora globulifera]|nr:hypothetical protein BGZ98_001439 [Dissophora globulifera]
MSSNPQGFTVGPCGTIEELQEWMDYPSETEGDSHFAVFFPNLASPEIILPAECEGNTYSTYDAAVLDSEPQRPFAPSFTGFMQSTMLNAARTPSHIQNSEDLSILLGQNNPVPTAPVLLVPPQMLSLDNEVANIDNSFALPDEISHCVQNTAPITPSSASGASSSRKTVVPECQDYYWAEPYVYSTKKVDNRANNATKQLKYAKAKKAKSSRATGL